MKNQAWRSHDTSLCSCCRRKNPTESSPARDRCRHTEHTHTLLHQPHIHPNSSSAEVPHIPLCSLPSQPLHCSSSILTSQAGASICLKFPPSCQNSNTRDKSCNFSFLIASRICINTLVPQSNKIYQELPIPNLTLSPTFCSLYTQNCLKRWHWELITRQGKCHKWLQPFSNQNTHQIAESARYTSLSRL